MKVNGVVITSSPAPMSSAIIATIIAMVPSATPMQCFAPTNAASFCSSSGTSGPMMYWPWSSTFCMRASMRPLSWRYWVLRSWSSILFMAFRGLRTSSC